uniref:Uncharacterized protein n=2 Tax=Macaca TaxID=9539 RepID=Q8HXK4_MACFA|nr:hypothetical protein [Macaca fascicularis]
MLGIHHDFSQFSAPFSTAGFLIKFSRQELRAQTFVLAYDSLSDLHTYCCLEKLSFDPILARKLSYNSCLRKRCLYFQSLLSLVQHALVPYVVVMLTSSICLLPSTFFCLLFLNLIAS